MLLGEVARANQSWHSLYGSNHGVTEGELYFVAQVHENGNVNVEAWGHEIDNGGCFLPSWFDSSVSNQDVVRNILVSAVEAARKAGLDVKCSILTVQTISEEL